MTRKIMSDLACTLILMFWLVLVAGFGDLFLP
jgi:hypothetical protein